MPRAEGSIFNKRAAEKLRSPDDLDKYVRVTNPSIWAILAACIALLAGLLIWGVFGAVTTSVSVKGTVAHNAAICFLQAEDVTKVHVGDIANVNGESMAVSTVATVPLSRDEVADLLESDYLVSTLVNGDWAYLVTLEGDVSKFDENIPIPMQIMVERVAPISLILKNWG